MTTPAASLPRHVPPALVVDFDIYTDPDMSRDVHLGLRKLHATAPDIFFTPRNEGHWVVTRHDLMQQVLFDTEHFSNRELQIPKSNSPYVMVPLNMDPPEQAPYRAVLLRHFSNAAVKAMEPKLRARAGQLIDGVKGLGRVDFTETLGAGFPVSVFMDIMGIPLDRFATYRGIVHEYFSNIPNHRRLVLQEEIFRYNTETIDAHRDNLTDDLISDLLTVEVNGRKLTDDIIKSMCFLLFLGGLDTVANAMTFAWRNLATRPDVQERLRADPGLIPDFVEESLRRFAVVNQTRIVKKDVDIAGAAFRVGDMVLCPLALAGLDDRINPDPERFDLDRRDRRHMTFSVGVHLCAGNILARNEMRIFAEEWVKRIPSFRLGELPPDAWRPGLVMALTSLPLVWEAAA